MSTTITVRKINPKDKTWLKREATRAGISMEEFVRQLIREQREKSQRKVKLSEIFKHYFGTEYGVDLPPRETYSYKPFEFNKEESK